MVVHAYWKKLFILFILTRNTTDSLFARSYIMKRGLFGPGTLALTKDMTAKVAKPN